MSCLLLLGSPNGPPERARVAPAHLQLLHTSPGGQDVTVSLDPSRSDDLHASARRAASLGYRILYREGKLRTQVVARFRIPSVPENVLGRSADLALTLLFIVEGFQDTQGSGYAPPPAWAATGVLEDDGSVTAVEQLAAKLAAACEALPASGGFVFHPRQSAGADGISALAVRYPGVRLVAVTHLDEALAHLGIVLDRVYLRNPYRGLQPFGFEHHAIFFGRSVERVEFTRQLLKRERAGVPGVLVEGPSGSGKSSFLCAGVLPGLVDPRLQPEDIQAALASRPVGHGGARLVWRPGLAGIADPLASLVRSMGECWQALPELPAEARMPEAGSLARLAELHRRFWPGARRFVWIIDQFEEILSMGLQARELEEFGQFLVQLQAQGAWTLACIRSDAWPQLKAVDSMRLVFGTNDGQFYLPSVRSAMLEEIITLPAEAAELRFGATPDGRRLDQLLREDALRDEGTLPLLQFTLNELYQHRDGRELTYAVYRSCGGIAGSVANVVDRVLGTSVREPGSAASRALRCLVGVDQTGRAGRRYLPLEQVDRDPELSQLLRVLVDERLCVSERRGDIPVVSLAHESLLFTVPAIVDWLKRETALLQARELAEHDARLWLQHGQSDAWLASADKLAAIETLEVAGLATRPEVHQYLVRSRRHARRMRRLRSLATAAIALLAIMASVAAWVASQKRHEAEANAMRASRTQLQLLTEAAAERLKDGDQIFARGIILEVLRRKPPGLQPDPATVNVVEELRAGDAAQMIMSGHTSKVGHVSWSPDGSRLVTGAGDSTARIWDASTGVMLHLLSGHQRAVASVMFSPDGARVLTASPDGTARIWDAGSGAPLRRLDAGSPAYSARYSADGKLILLSSLQGLQVWDPEGHLLRRLPAVQAGDAAEGFYPTAEWSPDGRRIALTAADHTARVLDARSGAQLLVLRGHRDSLLPLEYSRDGRRILTCSYDSSARVWDARDGRLIAVLNGPKGYCFGAAFSPDGTRVATGLGDKTARIWDAATGRQLRVLSGHVDMVAGVAFSPDGNYLASGSWDHTARTWSLSQDASIRVLTGHSNQVTSVAYSPDGSQLLSAAADKTARIWDARTGRALLTIRHGGSVASAVYSPDGTRILTASDDKTLRISDARSGKQLQSWPAPDRAGPAGFSGDGLRVIAAYANPDFDVRDASSGAIIAKPAQLHDNYISTAAFSPDGTRILTASMDKTARLWDASTLRPIAVLPHSGMVNQAAWSPDGRTVCTVSTDSLAHIWDGHDGRELRVLTGHHAYVYSVAYAPDGKRVVTGSDDQSVRIWDLATGRQLAVLNGHQARVQGLSVAPDGRTIASASVDGTVRLWDARVDGDWRAQVLWQQAVEADRLESVQATQLGVPSTLRTLADATLGITDERGLRTAASAQGGGAAAATPPAEPPQLLAKQAAETELAAVTGAAPLRDRQLLAAFRLYARAIAGSTAARVPEELARTWRYRRASLARALAAAGNTAAVTEAMAQVLGESAH